MKTAINLFGARVFGSALQAILLILIARETTVSEFGLFSAAFGVAALICSFCDLGLSVLLPRFLMAQEAKKLAQARNLHKLLLVLLLFGSSIFLTICAFTPSLWQFTYLPILFFAVALEFQSETQLTIPIAKELAKSVSLSLFLRRFMPLAFFITFSSFVEIDGSLNAAFSLLVGGLIGWLHVYRLNLRLVGELKFEPSQVFGLRKDVAGIMPNQIFVSARNLDLPLVGYLGGASSAAAYSLGLRFANPVSMIASSIASVVLPRMVGATLQQANYLFRQLVKYSISLATLIAIVSPLILGPSVNFLFGQKYGFAVPVIVVILVASPIIAITAPATSILLGLGLDKRASLIAASYATSFVITVSIGALFSGALGAAFGSLLSALIRLFLTHRALARV